jgi:hypothetical protein
VPTASASGSPPDFVTTGAGMMVGIVGPGGSPLARASSNPLRHWRPSLGRPTRRDSARSSVLRCRVSETEPRIIDVSVRG